MQGAEFGDVRRRFAGVVEAVVGLRQPLAARLHQLPPVIVIALAHGFQAAQVGGKRESLEAVSRRILASVRSVKTYILFM